MENKLDTTRVTREAVLQGIREKYGKQASDRRIAATVAAATLEARKIQLSEILEERNKYNGIISHDAAKERQRLNVEADRVRGMIKDAETKLAAVLGVTDGAVEAAANNITH